MNYDGCKRKFDVTAFEMKYRRKSTTATAAAAADKK